MPSTQAPADIKAMVRQYLADNVLLAGGADQLRDDSSFLERNLLDSTGVLELVSFIEDTWAVKVGDDEVVPENLDSIERVASYVARKKMAEKGGAS
jgi:acyl carrier protein